MSCRPCRWASARRWWHCPRTWRRYARRCICSWAPRPSAADHGGCPPEAVPRGAPGATGPWWPGKDQGVGPRATWRYVRKWSFSIFGARLGLPTQFGSWLGLPSLPIFTYWHHPRGDDSSLRKSSCSTGPSFSSTAAAEDSKHIQLLRALVVETWKNHQMHFTSWACPTKWWHYPPVVSHLRNFWGARKID